MDRTKDKDLIDITCELRHETAKAYLIDVGDDEPCWVPKSQCEYYKDNSGEIVTMPTRLAKEKGFI
jgi:hypothetical protein